MTDRKVKGRQHIRTPRHATLGLELFSHPMSPYFFPQRERNFGLFRSHREEEADTGARFNIFERIQ